jgi:hypothetical protein
VDSHHRHAGLRYYIGTHIMINKRRLVMKAAKDPQKAEEMLRLAGWTYDGPAKHKETAPYWINPRTKRKYTKEAAINIEELHEQLD